MANHSHIRVTPVGVRKGAPHNSFWLVEFLVPGGRQYLAVTDDFGNLREVPKDRAAHSSFAGNA